MSAPLTPRPHQIEARRGVYRSWRAGHARVVLVVPTGGGKGLIAALIIRDAVDRWHRVLVITHRTEIIDQLCGELASHGLVVGAISPGSVWPANRDAPVQVASVQTLAARDTVRPLADLIVWDECVTGDTCIGGKRADEIRVGDMVDAWNGHSICRRAVRRVYVHRASTLRTLHVSGTSVTVTDTHPVWIEGKGWIDASDVEAGDMCRVRRPSQEVSAWQQDEGVQSRVPGEDDGLGRCAARADPCREASTSWSATAAAAMPSLWCPMPMGGRRVPQDVFRQAFASATMAKTNRKHASARMRVRNPSHDPAVRARVSATLRAIGHRPPWIGGKGRGTTEPQRRLWLGLGDGWVTEFAIGVPRLPELQAQLPTCIYIDVAHPVMKIAIEVDGGSHCLLKTRAADARKETYLRSLGWTVLRFTNEEVMARLEGALTEVSSTISRLMENTTSSPTGS